ncbi:hypothetical protein BH23GEM5_BH23GEM5_09770 [soil metagenome]
MPEEHQIRGLGYTVVTVPTHQPTQHFLTEGLGLRHDHTYPVADAPQYLVHVYTIGDGGAHAEVHVVVRDDLPRARHGAGGVHHVALRVPDAQHIEDWAARLSALGYMNSGVVERFYFTSVYVREPNHVLFELATDGPGFEVDGPLDGERLKAATLSRAATCGDRGEIEASGRSSERVIGSSASVAPPAMCMYLCAGRAGSRLQFSSFRIRAPRPRGRSAKLRGLTETARLSRRRYRGSPGNPSLRCLALSGCGSFSIRRGAVPHVEAKPCAAPCRCCSPPSDFCSVTGAAIAGVGVV